jgi:quercetin dioxygenase-like cupin family protein
MDYEIFKSIPHQRVVSKQAHDQEIFDLYQCGIFNNNFTEENVELVELQPLSEYSPHFHKNSSAVVYVISGTGFFQLAGNLIEYKPGIRIDIPAGVIHSFKTNTPTLFLSIQSPPIINPDNGEIDLHYENGDKHETKF